MASLAFAAGFAGCKQSAPPQQATIIDNNQGPDPASANLAPVDETSGQNPPANNDAPSPGSATRYAPHPGHQPAQGGYAPQQQGAPAYPAQQYATQPQLDGTYSDRYPDYGVDGNPGVTAGYAALEEASQPPPPLPVYEQPPAPEQNDLWTPGYWSYGNQGYYWVPGAWCPAPYAGALWTPGYWGYAADNLYRFHRGFWARHIGFYGGIPYGYGYTGSGYQGGFWRGNDFVYNQAANRVNVTNIHNVYQRNVTTINNTYVTNNTRISYNGGAAGIQARPAPQELAVLREQRLPPTQEQTNVRQQSASNGRQFFNQNHGQPPVAVINRVAPSVQAGPAPAVPPPAPSATLNAARPGSQIAPHTAPPQQIHANVPRTATAAPPQRLPNPAQYGSTPQTQRSIQDVPQRRVPQTPPSANATQPGQQPRLPQNTIATPSTSSRPPAPAAPPQRPPFVRQAQPTAPQPRTAAAPPASHPQMVPPVAPPHPQPPAAPAVSPPHSQVLQQPRPAPSAPQKQIEPQRPASGTPQQHQPLHGEHPN